MRLVVVGGGIAGLAGAYEATLAGVDVAVLEASDRLGGKVWTELVDGDPLEWGPDSFLSSKPWGRELAAELGLEMAAPGPAAGRAYLLLGGRLRPLPRGTVMGVPGSMSALVDAVRSGILSPAGALRAALEPLMPGGPADPDAASVEEVASRRLGREAARRLVEPLVGGVFGAPASEIGLGSGLAHAAGARSLVLASARALRRRSRGPAFLAIRGGMGRLVDALVDRLADVRTGVEARALRFGGDGFAIETSAGEEHADALLLAVPAPTASRLLAGVGPEASAALAGVKYSSSAVVQLGFEPGSVGRELDGSGYLVAPEEHAVTAAVSWLPAKWPHIQTERVWLRAVATSPEALSLGDDELAGRVSREVCAVMGARRPPERVVVRRWREALPVFGPGHHRRIEPALAALPPRVALAGAFLEGVGLPDCIRTGREAARRLVRTPVSE